MHTIPKSYDTYELSRQQQISFFIISSIGILAATYLFYKSVILCFISLFAAFPLQKYYKLYLAHRRKRELNYQFRDALYSISASVSAGRQMPEAILEAKESMELIYANHGLITAELSRIVTSVYENRESEETALRDFAERSGLEDIREFVEVYFTCRATGGDLEKVIMKTSDIIMDKINIDKEIHVLTAQKRFEAKILTTIPFVVVLFLQCSSPDYISVMYETVLGKCIMTLVLAAVSAAYFLSVKITDIKV